MQAATLLAQSFNGRLTDPKPQPKIGAEIVHWESWDGTKWVEKSGPRMKAEGK